METACSICNPEIQNPSTINCLMCSSFGLPTPYVHKLFTALVIPQVEYALPGWYMPISIDPHACHSTGSIQHTSESQKFKGPHESLLQAHSTWPPMFLKFIPVAHQSKIDLQTHSTARFSIYAPSPNPTPCMHLTNKPPSACPTTVTSHNNHITHANGFLASPETWGIHSHPPDL